jgi:hypothetical protein
MADDFDCHGWIVFVQRNEGVVVLGRVRAADEEAAIAAAKQIAGPLSADECVGIRAAGSGLPPAPDRTGLGEALLLGDQPSRWRRRRRRGDRGHKLDRQKAREIRNLRASGLRVSAIAKRFGVSGQMIYDILHGRYWRG